MYSSPYHSQYGYPPLAASVIPAASVAAASSPQYGSHNHSHSSAFSSSANPDEDWTKISDLAERRRIQNRIAQRNYRKKLKRRLEDLERRAGSTDAGSGSLPITDSKSPGSKNSSTAKSGKSRKQQHTLSSLSAVEAAQQRRHQQRQEQQQQQQQPHEQQQQASEIQTQRHSVSSVSPSASPAPPSFHQPQILFQSIPKHTLSQNQLTPPMTSEDDLFLAPQHYDHRSRSHTPPVYFSTAACSAYPPPPDDMIMNAAAAAAAAASYRPASAADTAFGYGSPWAMPVTLRPMGGHGSQHQRQHQHQHPHPQFQQQQHHHHQHHNPFGVSTPDSLKRGSATSDDMTAATVATMAPFMSYSFLPTTGIDAANPYDSDPHTPPLSHSYDRSTNCSDAGYDCPTTPLSIVDSPGVMV